MTTQEQGNRELAEKLGAYQQPKQLDRGDLKGMSPDAIVAAQDDGHLDEILGRSS